MDSKQLPMQPLIKCSMCEQIMGPSYEAALLGPKVSQPLGGTTVRMQRIQRLCSICYEDVASYITSHNEEPDYNDSTLDGENLQRTDRSEVE